MTTVFNTTCRLLSVIVFAAFVSACGGGGGEGNGANSSITSSISIQLRSPTLISADVTETTKMPDVTVTGSAVGDLSKISGKTIYVLIESPDNLFKKLPGLSVSESGGFSLFLQGDILPVAGKYQGQISVYVCLDEQCKDQFSNSPLRIPYAVNVLPGLKVSTSSLEVSRVFGDELLVSRLVQATLPKDVSILRTEILPRQFYVQPDIPGNSLQPLTVTVGRISGGATDLSFDFNVMPPGEYIQTVQLMAGPIPGSPSLSIPAYNKSVAVKYIVKDNPNIDVAFDPPQGVKFIKQGDPLIKEFGYNIVTRPGFSAIWDGVEYLSSPASASSISFSRNWWDQLNQYFYGCAGSINESVCLPVGEYTARIRYRVVNGANSKIVYYPLKMVIN